MGWRRARSWRVANAIILLVVTGGIAWEGLWRLSHPAPVRRDDRLGGRSRDSGQWATALLFARGRRGEPQMSGARSAPAADAIVSAGVVIAGVAIMMTGLVWLDPAGQPDRLGGDHLRHLGSGRQAIGLALDAVPGRDRPPPRCGPTSPQCGGRGESTICTSWGMTRPRPR